MPVMTVRLLVDSGADVDLQNSFGATAINLAVSNGHVEVVKALVMSGARIDVPVAGDITPLDMAKYSYKDSYRKYGAKSAEVQACFSIIGILQTAGAREDIKVLLSRLNREKIQVDALKSQKSRVLSEIIEKGRDIVPAVLWAMEKKNLAITHGSIILEKIGNPAVDPMVEFLEYQEPYSPVAMVCVYTLGKLGRGSAEAASILAVLYSRLLENDKKTRIGTIYLDTIYAIRPDWVTKQHLESLKNSLRKEYLEEK